MTKKGASPIPINFSLTERARVCIQDIITRCRAEKAIDPIPAMSWVTGQTGPESHWQEIKGPCIGVFDRPQIPADVIQYIDGIEIVFNVPTECVALFAGRVIDFSEERGIHFAD